MIEKSTWEFINTFAPWFAAIGTLAAVIVSLYLARQDRRIKLKVSAGHRMLVTEGQQGKSPQYIVISVVNVGHREAKVTGIGWEVGLRKKISAYQTVPRDGLSSTIPVKLEDGDEANYYIPLQGELKWIESFNNDILKPHPKFNLIFTKVVVFTSIGKVFKSKIEKGLQNKILEVINQS
ncbi:hypothetical protein ACFL2X_03275 [Candidatus Latescibacterota bacterium]